MATKNNINAKQNSKKSQEMIVAQHYTYREAKLWVFILFMISVIIPLCINIGLIWVKNETIAAIISFFSIITLIITELIRNKIAKIKEIAASIQQLFDISVFGLKNDFCINKDEVFAYLRKYKNKDWERKINWYTVSNNIEHNKAVFYCQKENIDWTQSLSKKFKSLLYLLISLLVVMVVLNFIFINDSIIHIISVIITSLPLLSYVYCGLVKIKNDDDALDELNKYTLVIEGILKTSKDIDLYIENLQWMIFYLRKNKYLIPDWFDKLYYKKIQEIETEKSKQVNKIK
ncbi:MAG: hypothetical protein E7354_03350 [Clostridiales bacterium]|nr:hypothetical protein [Clostridiales bacterium]